MIGVVAHRASWVLAAGRSWLGDGWLRAGSRLCAPGEWIAVAFGWVVERVAARGRSRGFGQHPWRVQGRRARASWLRRAQSPGACRVAGTVVALPPNQSFKPTLLRSTKPMAGRACHGFGSATQRGLTQSLALTHNFARTHENLTTSTCSLPDTNSL